MEDESTEPKQIFEIPRIFFSDLTGALLEKCISCERKLLEDNVNYVIEKALKMLYGYKSYSTIFEYAMCLKCAEKMRGNISSKSMQNIHQYFVENVDFNQFNDQQVTGSNGVIEQRIEKCIVKGKYAEELNECQIYAQCIGDKMVLSEFPYMMSGEAMDEIVGLMSSETLDDLNNLKDELVGPSEFQDLLKSGPKVFI